MRAYLRRLAAWLQRPSSGALALFLCVLALYSASMSREIPWGDARPIFEAADRLVAGEGLSVHTRWPSHAPPGRDGRFWAPQPLVTSLVHVPGAAVKQLLGHLHLSPEWARLSSIVGCHLAGALLGAALALLFLRLCREHGASARAARFAVLGMAFGSIVWVYARYPFSEIAQTTAFTGLFLALTRHLRAPSRRHALWVGLWAGLLFNTKYLYLLVLPGALLLSLWVARRTLRELAAQVLHAALGFLPGLLVALAYNTLRFGAPLRTGYGEVSRVMVENPLFALWGFLFSPGKSLFLYTPLLLLAALGLARFWRTQRMASLAMAVTVGPVILFYSRFPIWPGDFAWGPRYAVFAVPVLLLPAVALLDQLRWRAVGAALLVAGLAVQAVGNAFYWDHSIRIAHEVRTRWLGSPNRTRALAPDKGGFCEGCFEDIYPTVWLPPFQPIHGNLWLLTHVPFGHDWKQAAEDAPWRRYTTLDVDFSSTYARVRIDHWLAELPGHPRLRWFMFGGLLALGLGAGAVFWRRSGRDAVPAVSTAPIKGTAVPEAGRAD